MIITISKCNRYWHNNSYVYTIISIIIRIIIILIIIILLIIIINRNNLSFYIIIIIVVIIIIYCFPVISYRVRFYEGWSIGSLKNLKFHKNAKRLATTNATDASCSVQLETYQIHSALTQ